MNNSATNSGGDRKEQKELQQQQQQNNLASNPPGLPQPPAPPSTTSTIARNNEQNFFKQFEHSRQTTTTTAPGGGAGKKLLWHEGKTKLFQKIKSVRIRIVIVRPAMFPAVSMRNVFTPRHVNAPLHQEQSQMGIVSRRSYRSISRRLSGGREWEQRRKVWAIRPKWKRGIRWGRLRTKNPELTRRRRRNRRWKWGWRG